MAENAKHNYDESKIKTLSSLEHIRLRTGMYIGRIGTGAHPTTAVTQGVVSVAMRSLMAGTEFTMFGDGTSVRDYIDADDVAEAIWGACGDKRFEDRIWNIGSGVGHSLREILEFVEAAAGRKLTIRQLPSRNIDVKRIVLNCGRVAADIGWFPRRNIVHTIANMWRGFLGAYG